METETMMKTLLTAVALSAVPAFALAGGCNWGKSPQQTTASTCAEGQTFDVATQSCVDSVTS
jgi:hypothetical protein